MINHFVWQLTGDKEIRRRQYRGASALQSVVRGHQVRTYMKRVKRMREIHRRNKAATVIQIPYRARLLRKAQDRNLALVKRAVKFIEERMAEKYMWRAIRYGWLCTVVYTAYTSTLLHTELNSDSTKLRDASRSSSGR